MDDPPFHCNKSTIYVLNTNYNYGNFGGLNTDLASRPYFSYQSTDHLLPPGKTGNSDSNYTNGTTNSSSNSSRCGVSALANFFPCSNAFSHLQPQSPPPPPPSLPSHQKPHRNSFFNFQSEQQQQQQEHQRQLIQHQLQLNNHYSQQLQQSSVFRPILNGIQKDQPTSMCISPATAALLRQNNKKLPAIKSTIIAKKTKFWKFLEEEKWKKNSLENFSNSNCERNSSNNNTSDKGSEQPARGHLNLHIRNDSSSTSTSMDMDQSTTSASTTTTLLLNNENNNGYCINNNNCNSKNNNCCNNTNNNSYNNTKTLTTATAATSSTSNSTMDLYREAVQLLGLSCTLCDNCRCIDCQSRYFECDDDFDCDDSLEDCFDTFGHFDGGSFDIEPDETYDIHGIYNAVQLNRNSTSCDCNSNSNTNSRCGYNTLRSQSTDECLENNCQGNYCKSSSSSTVTNTISDNK